MMTINRDMEASIESMALLFRAGGFYEVMNVFELSDGDVLAKWGNVKFFRIAADCSESWIYPDSSWYLFRRDQPMGPNLAKTLRGWEHTVKEAPAGIVLEEREGFRLAGSEIITNAGRGLCDVRRLWLGVN